MRPDLVIISAKFRDGQYEIASHADDEMQNDRITLPFLEEAIGRDKPKIIERYRHSCLILGWGSPNEPIHAVVALGTINVTYDTPILVTVYRPDRNPEKWKKNYAKRKKKCI